MSDKPIFVATHPRACSTAFERVFMTRRDILKCIHEPFGDAFYYGPERMAERIIMERINKENIEGKRLFIKDMVQYLVPPNQKPVSLAPSLLKGTAKRQSYSTNNHSNSKGNRSRRAISTEARVIESSEAPLEAPYDTISEAGNPTVVPSTLLKQFQFVFLIRHPRKSIPSYYRCCIPPLSDLTGFDGFRPDEAGYNELRRTFDYLRAIDCLGQGCKLNASEEKLSSVKTSGLDSPRSNANICVMDADDLLSAPEKVLSVFCEFIDVDFSPRMLNWDNAEDQNIAIAAFEKWKGFHEDAVQSKDLKPREKAGASLFLVSIHLGRFISAVKLIRGLHKDDKRTDQDYYDEWVEKYGDKAARIIQKAVDDNTADYEYLKQFAIKV